MDLVENQQIDLLDENNVPLLQKQLTSMTNGQQNPDTGAADEEDILEEGQINIRTASPDARKLDNAELHVEGQGYQELEGKVIDYVRRNSLLKDAKNL